MGSKWLPKLSFLSRNVSFRATMSNTFSFIYNSSSLRFGLIPWQFQNKMFKPMKVVKGYLSWMNMCYDGLVGGFRQLGDSLDGVAFRLQFISFQQWISS